MIIVLKPGLSDDQLHAIVGLLHANEANQRRGRCRMRREAGDGGRCFRRVDSGHGVGDGSLQGSFHRSEVWAQRAGRRTRATPFL